MRNRYTVSCPYCDYEPEIGELVCGISRRTDGSFSVIMYDCKRCHVLPYAPNTAQTFLWGYR